MHENGCEQKANIICPIMAKLFGVIEHVKYLKDHIPQWYDHYIRSSALEMDYHMVYTANAAIYDSKAEAQWTKKKT